MEPGSSIDVRFFQWRPDLEEGINLTAEGFANKGLLTPPIGLENHPEDEQIGSYTAAEEEYLAELKSVWTWPDSITCINFATIEVEEAENDD